MNSVEQTNLACGIVMIILVIIVFIALLVHDHNTYKDED